jgi:hypothetical protein
LHVNKALLDYLRLVPNLTPLFAKSVERKMCLGGDEPIRIAEAVESVKESLHRPAEKPPKSLKFEVVSGLR